MAWCACKPVPAQQHVLVEPDRVIDLADEGQLDAAAAQEVVRHQRALGQRDQARKHLERALTLNAHFDPRQAPLAEAAWKEIRQ